MKMYSPPVDFAYKQMQKELETKLKKSGKVKKVQTKKDPFGEQNSWRYQVYDKGGKLIAEVTYSMGSNHVVEVKKGSIDDKVERYFRKDFDKNFKKHERRFKI